MSQSQDSQSANVMAIKLLLTLLLKEMSNNVAGGRKAIDSAGDHAAAYFNGMVAATPKGSIEGAELRHARSSLLNMLGRPDLSADD